MMHSKKSPHLRSLSLRVRVLHPNTRIDVRLLGPCFKTGGLRSLRQHPSQKTQSSVQVGSINKVYNTPPKQSHIPMSLSYHPNRCWPSIMRVHNPRRKDNHKTPSLISSPSLSTISRTFSLSFQSSFHLSITVLVRYRSLANIQLQMEFTTHLELHSQTTRLFESTLQRIGHLIARDSHPL